MPTTTELLEIIKGKLRAKGKAELRFRFDIDHEVKRSAQIMQLEAEVKKLADMIADLSKRGEVLSIELMGRYKRLQDVLTYMRQSGSKGYIELVTDGTDIWYEQDRQLPLPKDGLPDGLARGKYKRYLEPMQFPNFYKRRTQALELFAKKAGIIWVQ